MEMENITRMDQFILLGFSINRKSQIILFAVICNIYITTIFTNVLIITIIWRTRSLHKPMYIFIGTFSFLEIWYPTATVPRFLSNLLTWGKSIQRTGCIAQLYFHFSLGATENFLLITMAFDRYVAICNPMHYSTIMNHRMCAKLALGCWVGGFLALIPTAIQISNLHFCGANVIDHYYCDFAPLVTLSCSDTYNAEFYFFILVSVVLLGCFLIIIASYVRIMWTIFRLSNSNGRMKAFSTCASHFTVILIFYGTTIFMFVKPTGRSSLHVNKVVSIFPSVVTPLLNPIIYTLRNKEIMDTLRKTVCSAGSSHRM